MRSAAGVGGVAGLIALLSWPVDARAGEMRGITATEIKIGQTMPYSGPVSAFGALGKGEVGYFKMLNERGGINGRKVNLISLDESRAGRPDAVHALQRQELGTFRRIADGELRFATNPGSSPLALAA